MLVGMSSGHAHGTLESWVVPAIVSVFVLAAGGCSDPADDVDAWEPGSSDTQAAASSSGDGTTGSHGTDGGDSTGVVVDSSSGGEPPCVPDGPPPERILFIGNSFTLQQDVTGKFRELVIASGFPEPTVEMRAVGGYRLEQHRADTDAAGAPSRVSEGWDVVVLQEYSTRPTDSLGDPEQFKLDATWFYDQARDANPAAQVFLYETWARHADHSFYPGSFDDPSDMQAQLRFHYLDAARDYIPAAALADPPVEVGVALVGDAWEHVLEMGEPVRLHASDDYHQNPAGAYLNALVLFGTIYERRTEALVAIDVSERDAALLQAAADWITAAEVSGGPMTCDADE